MENKFCIIIDERDQRSEIKVIEEGLAPLGFRLRSVQLNLSNAKFHSTWPNGSIFVDREKIKAELTRIPFFKRAHTIAVDYNLVNNIPGVQNTGLTGFDVINDIRDLGYNPNKEIVLYSSGIDNALTDILSSEDVDSRLKRIKKLFRANINFQRRRHGYTSSIIDLLRKKPNTLDGIFIEKMQEYPNFKSDFFDGMPIYDLEQVISNRDSNAIRFKEELVDQFIAYIIRISDEF